MDFLKAVKSSIWNHGAAEYILLFGAVIAILIATLFIYEYFEGRHVIQAADIWEVKQQINCNG